MKTKIVYYSSAEACSLLYLCQLADRSHFRSLSTLTYLSAYAFVFIVKLSEGLCPVKKIKICCTCGTSKHHKSELFLQLAVINTVFTAMKQCLSSLGSHYYYPAILL